MAKRDLWDSKVSIPSQRRTAPQINPGVAKMFSTTGAEKVGAAIFDVGTQIHQVNIARQVASALAQYKMASANFLAQMQNADPSTVNFEQAFRAFQAQQGGLAQGVSRDASNIISNKMKSYAASTYGDVKRIELRNTRGMVLAEIPDIIDNLTKEQAKAELMGDTERANRAQQDLQQYLTGVSHALRPYEIVKIQSAITEALEDARHDTEKEAIYNALLINPKAAGTLIKNSKYLNGQEKLSLTKQANAASVNKIKRTLLQKKMFKDKQSETMLKSWMETGTFAVPPELHSELQPIVDAYADIQSSDISNAIGDEDHFVALKLDNAINMKLKPIPWTEMFEAGTLLNRETMKDFIKDNQQTIALQKNKAQVIRVLTNIDNKISDAMAIAAKMDVDKDVINTIHKQLEDERTLLVRSTKKQFVKGDDPIKIIKAIDDIFEGTTKGILEQTKWRKFKPALWGFKDKLERGEFGDEPLKNKRRMMINLLMADNYEAELEAIISDAQWFKAGNRTVWDIQNE